MIRRLLLLAAPALALASLVRAQPETPALRHGGGVAYVNAGIDAASRARAEQLAPDMNLRLEFVGPAQAPVRDAAIEIIDGRGERVLDLASAGPLLLARLEPGPYRVRASLAGQTIERSLTVPDAGRHSERLQWSTLPAR
jgi:hypothetical protein